MGPTPDAAYRLKTLAEKLLWIAQNFSHLEEAYKAASSQFIRAAGVPRSCDWKKDRVIGAIVESSDKQNTSFQSMAALCAIVSKEIKDVAEDALLCHEKHQTGEAGRQGKLLASFQELKHKKKLHAKALASEKKDPWKTDMDLRCALRRYLRVDSENEQEATSSVRDCDSMYSRLFVVYTNAFQAHIRSLQSHYSILCNVLPEAIEWSVENDMQSVPKQEALQIGLPLESTGLFARFNEAYAHVLMSSYEGAEPLQQSVEKLQEHVGMKGCGLFKHRKTFGKTVPLFFVLTKRNFLHCFLVSNLLTKFSESSAMVAKLQEAISAASAPFSFIFESSAVPRELTLEEEEELERLNLFICERLEHAKPLGGVFPLSVAGKRVRIDRDKVEITIEDDGIKYLSRTQVKLKGLSVGQVQRFYEIFGEKGEQEPSTTPQSAFGESSAQPAKLRVSWSTATLGNPWTDAVPGSAADEDGMVDAVQALPLAGEAGEANREN